MRLRLLPALLVAATGLAMSNAWSIELTATQALGKLLFFDTSLSINRNQSCATCHSPAAGWTGPDSSINADSAVYPGSVPDRSGHRRPPSSAYATQSPVLHHRQISPKEEALFIGGNFWDGRATGERLGSPAAEQAQGPFLNPDEQALPTSACVVHRVCTGAYWALFSAVWGAESCGINWTADPCEHREAGTGSRLGEVDLERITRSYDAVALSIAAYEASPESNAFTSKFDYAMKGKASLTAREQAGLRLFKGKGKCSNCHVLTPTGKSGALLTDFTFDNLGLPRNPANPVYATNPGFVDIGLGAFLASRPEYGHFADASKGKHKVPTLRNVDLRPYPGFVKAFGHNGYFKSLKSIVHFYNTRDVKPACPPGAKGLSYTEAQALAAHCWPPPEVPHNVNTEELGNLKLTDAEENAIVEFMKTLSDGYVP